MLILVSAGLSWGGQIYPWASAHTLATLLIGAVLLVAFFVWGEFFFWRKKAIGELTRFSVQRSTAPNNLCCPHTFSRICRLVAS
jgi:hypothetical protein